MVSNFAMPGHLLHISSAKLILVAYLASGAAGLIYEVMATRALGAVVGGTALAGQLVFSVFFGGLTAGAWASRRLIRLFPGAGIAFGAIEIALAGAELLSFWLCRSALDGFAKYIDGGTGASSSAFALLVTCIVCLPVTFLMGATFPAVAAALQSVDKGLESTQTILSRAYAVNTAGAVLGALASTWLLLRTLGTWGTWLCGVALSALAGTAVLIRSKAEAFPITEARSLGADRQPKGMALAAILAGFAGISLEIVAIRILAVSLTDTIYTFSLAVAAFILGVAAASSIWQRLSSKSDQWYRLSLLSAAPAAACWLLTPRLMTLVPRTLLAHDSGFLAAAAVEALCALLVAAPAAFPSTFVFLALAAQVGEQNPSRGARFAALWNGVGCAAAPLLCALLVLPKFGLFAVCALSVLALGLAAFFGVASSDRKKVVWVLMAAPAFGLALVVGLHPLHATPGWHLIWKRQGGGALVTVEESSQGHRRLRTNNTFSEGGDKGQFAQQRQGLLPAMFAQQAKSALVLGVGSGSTLAAVARALPQAQVHAVELLPEVVQALPFFRAQHDALLDSARVTVQVADARTYVAHAAATKKRFDLVVGDLFHASQAGVGALYAVEHFANVARILSRPSGVYAQWVPLHEVSPIEVKVIVKSFLRVFPNATAFLGGWGLSTPLLCLLGTASGEPLRLDIQQLKLWLQADVTRGRAVLASGFGDVAENLAFFVGQGRALARFAGSSKENTDVYPRLELDGPIHRQSESGLANLVELSKLRTSPRFMVQNAPAALLDQSDRIAEGLGRFAVGIAAWNEGRLDAADSALADALAHAPGAAAISQSLIELRRARALR